MNKKQWGCLVSIVIIVLAVTSQIFAQEEQPVSTPDEERVNINFAALEELVQLPGIDEELAQRILEGRFYQKIDELLDIKGISQEKLNEIQNQIVIKPLNINAATIEELMLLPGVDAELAEQIILHGPYRIPEELFKIPGFGEERFQKIQELIEAQPVDAQRKKGWGGRTRPWKTEQPMNSTRDRSGSREKIEEESLAGEESEEPQDGQESEESQESPDGQEEEDHP